MLKDLNVDIWYSAILSAAGKKGLTLPPVSANAMGTVIWQRPGGNRAVTLKHRLLPLNAKSNNAVTWGAWLTGEEVRPVVLFSEQAAPTPDRLEFFLAVFDQWLGRDVQPEHLREFVRNNKPQATLDIEASRDDSKTTLMLGADDEFEINVDTSSWSLSCRGRSLSTHRTSDSAVVAALPLDSLNHFRRWLATNWDSIAFEIDSRPQLILEGNGSACRAYEDGVMRAKDNPVLLDPLKEWWSTHAIRAADPALPNIFIERQEDDIVVSWDSMPSGDLFYPIGFGTEPLPVTIAVPALRRLMTGGVGSDTKCFSAQLFDEKQSGYDILRAYHTRDNVSPAWLESLRFTERDAAGFGATGTSRHPVVGLLRSSRATQLTLSDIESVFGELVAASPTSYQPLRRLAHGLYSQIDPREPWESGYRMAREIRKRLGLSQGDKVDIDAILTGVSVKSADIDLGDSSVKGACVGTPHYAPVVIANRKSPDASGVSGRQITLVHELCHLLFDRSRMRRPRAS